MQYKSIVLTAVITLSSLSLRAQQYQSFVMKAPTRVIKTDTIIMIQKGTKTAPLAANACVPDKAVASKYKPVPLAGEKSYFGEMNEYVTDFVRQYLQVHSKTLTCVQGRGNTSFSLMDNVLQKNDIPKELKYLAVIESALNHNAVSHAGAVGPWQLMESTARLMGLTVNSRRDDRKDWYKSTNAAARYLSYLYTQMNDWLLVIAAYNSGPGPVQRAINRTGSRNFWDIKKYLPRETQGHVLAFIATASIFENLSKFINLGSIPTDFKFEKDVPALADKKATNKPAFTQEELQGMAIVRISQRLNMDLVAQELSVDKKLLARWNPDYDVFLYDDKYPSDFYSLRIPKDKLDNFVEKKEYLTKKSKQIFGDISM